MILMELEALTEKLGIQITYEKLAETRSGLCRLYNQYVLFVDKNLKAEDQVEVFIEALSRFPIENIHVLPGVRHLLAEYRSLQAQT